jgi:ankyrin repeat protein
LNALLSCILLKIAHLTCYKASDKGHEGFIFHNINKTFNTLVYRYITEISCFKALFVIYDRQEEGAMTLLVQRGAKLDIQNKKGQTSLHIAIGKGNVPCTKLLIKSGASVNLKVK